MDMGEKARMLRTDPRHIPSDWTIRPGFHIWPPRRQAALLWTLVHMIYYVIQHRERLSLTDYADFMRHARWKAYSNWHRLMKVGNYLDFL
jgi:hypothetical protein